MQIQIFFRSLLLGQNFSLTPKRGVSRELSMNYTSFSLEETVQVGPVNRCKDRKQ